MKIFGLVGMCLALLVAVPACDKDKKKDGQGRSSPEERKSKANKLVAPAFFKKIPADAIFVFANYERLDSSFVNAIADLIGPLIEAAKPDLMQESPEAAALVKEYGDVLTLAGLKKIGIRPAPHFAMYNQDLSFVLRVELEDGDALFDFVSKLISKYGLNDPIFAPKTAGTLRYWESPPDDVAMVIGIDKKEFVVAVMPSAVKQEIMPYIIGDKTPDKNIIDSKKLIELVAEYGGEKGLGYIDSVAAMKFLMSGNKGIAGTDLDLSRLDKVCKDEFMQLAKLMPKVIYGYDRLDTTEMSMFYGVKPRDDVALRLSQVVRPVPGYNYAAQSKAMGTMGLGFSIGDALSWASDTSKKLANSPYQCPSLRDLNSVLSKSEEASSKIPPVARDIEGMIAMVDSFNIDQPMASTGMVALQSSDVDGLLTIAKNFVPSMANLNLESGAQAVKLDLKPLGIPMDVYAARSKTMLGAAVGDAKQKLPKLVASKESKGGPFFVMNYNYESLIQIMAAQGKNPFANSEFADVLKKLGDMIFEMRATKAGVVMRSAVKFN